MRHFIKLFVYTICIYIGFCGVARACESNEIDVLGDGTQCETAKFSITTTELTANTEFKFYMSAKGTFYVDWGDGTVDTIVRNDTDETLYNHTYLTAGVKTILFGGLATGYSTQEHASAIRFGNYVADATTPTLIRAIDGSIGQIFPTLGVAASQQPCFSLIFARTMITSIPENLFSGVVGNATSMFQSAFNRCSNLVSIPENLFKNITGAAEDMFRYTFIYCSSLRSIPENLFSGISGCASGLFQSTFESCTSLEALPSGLFRGVTCAAATMFLDLFNGCTSLSGYIPPSMFAGLIAAGAPTASRMFDYVFFNTKLVRSCPAGTTRYMIGYENNTYWDRYASCVDTNNQICSAGEYLPQYYDSCAGCPENSYCQGGTYAFNETAPQGITACASGLFAPSGMWEAAQCGRILHVGDGFVYLRATKKTTPALHLDLDHDGIADYFGNMTTMDVPMSHGTSRKLKVRMNGIVYSIYDDSVDLGAQ